MKLEVLLWYEEVLSIAMRTYRPKCSALFRPLKKFKINKKMKKLALINPRNISNEKATLFSLREAARAIVIDDMNLIALLHVKRDGYYKLPGGGIEDGEDKIIALRRECLEEIGCNIEILQEVGSTIEYWEEDNEKQISYCYIAKVIGNKGTPNLTKSEKERGLETIWLSHKKVIETLNDCHLNNWEAQYIVPRELAFLEEAKKYLKSKKPNVPPLHH